MFSWTDNARAVAATVATGTGRRPPPRRWPTAGSTPGDVGFLDDAGHLFIVDRKKDMIVSGGSNVYARDVEEALAELPAVKEAR